LLLGGILKGSQGAPPESPARASAKRTVSEDAPAAARQRFREAAQLLRQGYTENALAAVREGLKVAPESVEGWNLLGLVYGQQKEYAPAVAALERALKLDPRSTKTHTNLGSIYFAQDKLDLSEKEFRASLRQDPRDRDANYNLGMVLLARAQPERALAFLKRITPPDDSSQIALIEAYFQNREPAQALRLARAVSEQARNDVRPHFSIGVLLAREKQYDPAIHELELADALSPGTPEILHNLGQAYLRREKYDKAEEALNRALSLSPDSPDTLYLLAEVYAAEQKDLQALELLLRARKLAPENTDIIFLLGRLSMMQSYYEDAIQVLEEGVKVAPRRPDLRAALGESYFSTGKVDKAIEEFQKLIELDPSAPSYAFMGLCYRHLGRFEDARKYLNEGLKKNPQNAACLYNLGFIDSKQGNYAGAEKVLEQSLRASPNYSDALYELGKVKMAEKKYDEAIPLFRKCSKLATRTAQVYYNLAAAERHAHLDEAADRDLKVFETLSKDASNAPYPFQHFLEALNQRVDLPPGQRAEIDLEELLRMDARSPNQPRTLYLLAETYLKLDCVPEARQRIAQLDQASGGDVRTALGVGTLLARYGMFSDAIQHFQAALAGDSASDDAKYNLANAYFEVQDYRHALEAILHCSPQGQEDEATLTLMGDIYAHLGRTSEATAVFEKAIAKNPDNDRHYLSLALTQLRSGNAAAARGALQRGLDRAPDSGAILWGLGILSVLQGENERAEDFLRRALDLMPEWHGSYLALETFYTQTGQADKAQETLKREARTFPRSGRVPTADAASPKFHALSPEGRQQFLQEALSLADDIF
jgi:tetratricopeptide (TPR) repeat protein